MSEPVSAELASFIARLNLSEQEYAQHRRSEAQGVAPPFPSDTVSAAAGPMLAGLLRGNAQLGGLLQGVLHACAAAPAGEGVSRRERELVLLAVLTMQGAQRNLAIHMFWAMTFGVSVPDIEATLAMVGSYAGIDRATSALTALRTTERVLARVLGPAAAQPPTELSVERRVELVTAVLAGLAELPT